MLDIVDVVEELPPLDSLGLPEKFTEWRTGQDLVVRRAIASERLLAEAPPGVGKTVIAAALQKVLGVPAVYITSNKSLQRQICREIPWARAVMGRNNYPCIALKGRTAEVCFHSREDPCLARPECPYVIARTEAEMSPLAVLNSTYYLYASNYANKFQRPLLIVDEADQFDSAILGFVKLDLSRRVLVKLGDPPVVGSVGSWVEWIGKVLPKVKRHISEAKEDEIARWKRLEGKLKYVIDNVDKDWFVEHDGAGISFRPLKVSRYANTLVWNNHQRVLGMSGTIIFKDIVADSLGLGKVDYIPIDCPFPAANRPIYFSPIEALNKDSKPDSIALALRRIFEGYPESKILVQTQSYNWAKALIDKMNGGVKSRLISNEGAGDREDVLDSFKSSKSPLVLMSPSFARGLDLYDDEYNCLVVAKAPYPNLGSKAVSLRLKAPGGQRWYTREAVAALVQMSFRIIRSGSKKGDIYILDANAGRLINSSPNWFKEAVQ